MKQHLSHLIAGAVSHLQQAEQLPAECQYKIHIERTRNPDHGDFACNIAMMLAKQAGCAPRELAEKLIAAMPPSDKVERMEIAGPGFINFFAHQETQFEVIGNILETGEGYGRSQVGEGQKVIVEFVSANPTGPLHVGHGRGAAFGAAVSDLLEAAGFNVHREYYVNDAGRQMDILTASVWLRYVDMCGKPYPFPSNGYRGEYIKTIASELKNEVGDALYHDLDEAWPNLPQDEKEADDGGDKEAHIDGIINLAKHTLGEQDYRKVLDKSLTSILDDIRDDLAGFGVHYQRWFSERSLRENKAVQTALDKLKQADCVYEKEGAMWFRATDYGDEKDRVLVRANGEPTYFGVDVAYHLDKVARGYDRLLDVMGADHHGYMPRVQGSLKAAGVNPDVLKPLLVQFAVLYRGSERVQMSTRSGSFVTLRELREEVGNDAARFFYVMRKHEQHMDFDLELAKSQSNDNPVYYIQYAHARICSVQRQLGEKQLTWDEAEGLANLGQLTESHESELMVHLAHYPELVESAAVRYEPHVIAHYLQELAQRFHTYYNAHVFISDQAALRNARLCLIMAVKQVLVNGLRLLGVSAPESM